MDKYKQLVDKDIELVDIEIEKAKFHIDLFNFVASKETDKKKRADVLLKAETLKDTIKKNEVYKNLLSEFLKSREIPSPYVLK